ncbi:MAG: hypothetical protein HY930_00245 [Euryarchaeota archaeon]|nr:hypothetical protein [Euryarchaeota archaeon]
MDRQLWTALMRRMKKFLSRRYELVLQIGCVLLIISVILLLYLWFVGVV